MYFVNQSLFVLDRNLRCLATPSSFFEVFRFAGAFAFEDEEEAEESPLGNGCTRDEMNSIGVLFVNA